MKTSYLETILVTLATILCAVAFLFAIALPKAFFLLALVINLSLCLGIEWIANIKKEYSEAYSMAAIATLVMSLLAYFDVHVAYTFIPSAIVSGWVSASATRETGGVIHGVILCIFTFFLLWVLNMSLMLMC